MTIGDWVLVGYEGEKYLGKVLSNRKDEVQVRCLEKLWGIQELQQFGRLDNAIFYKDFYASDTTPKWVEKGKWFWTY